MNNEFKKLSQGDVTRYVLENATGMGSGSVASMPMSVGGTRKRGDNLIAQEADKNTVPSTTPRNFVAKNAKTAGAGAHKDKSKTIPRKEKHKKPFMEDHSTASGGWGQGSYDTYTAGRHGRGVAEDERDHPDHEIQMASSELMSIAKNAEELLDMVRRYSEQEGLDAWQQSKITKAADYLNSVLQSISGEQGVAEGAPELLKKEMPTHRHAEKLLAQNGVSKDDPDYHHHLGNTIKHLRQFGNIDLINKSDEQGVAEGVSDTIYPNAEVIKSKNGRPVGEIYQDEYGWGCFHYKADNGADGMSNREEALEQLKDMHNEHRQQGVAEGSEDKIEQLKQDYATAVHWSKNEKSPQKREAARRKAETIKAHLEKQYKQGVAEGSEDSAEKYKAHLLKTAPRIMDFLAKTVKGWRPSEQEMLGAIDTAYTVMKHTGDVKQAGKAMMDELNTLHRMSQGQQGVAEGAKVDRQAKHITASMMKKGKSKKDAESIAWAHIKHPKNESADSYMESLNVMLERQLEPTMDLDAWNDNFQNADPNKYHQFKNKTPEKKK